MDPQATWNQLFDALAERDWDRTEELAEALVGWLVKRGFPPHTVGPESLGRQWHAVVAYLVCNLARSKVKDARRRNRRRRDSTKRPRE